MNRAQGAAVLLLLLAAGTAAQELSTGAPDPCPDPQDRDTLPA